MVGKTHPNALLQAVPGNILPPQEATTGTWISGGHGRSSKGSEMGRFCLDPKMLEEIEYNNDNMQNDVNETNR